MHAGDNRSIRDSWAPGIIRRSMLVFFVFVMVVFSAAALVVDMMRTKSKTLQSIHVVSARILDYARNHGALPPNLDVLSAKDKTLDTLTKDEWGWPLFYRVDDNGTVTLISFGRNGIPGGRGEDTDISGSFPTHDATGRWYEVPLVAVNEGKTLP